MEDTKLLEEIQAIVSLLSVHFATEGMRKSFAYETMKAKDADALFAMHEYLRECDKLLHEGKKPPLPALMDMAKTFGDLKRGMALDVESLSAVMDLLKASKTIRTMLEERRDCERLFEESYLLDPLESLERELERAIAPDMTIADTASAKLRETRQEIARTKKSLDGAMLSCLSRYGRYLSSDSVTLKGGDEALPVKLADKGNVRGSIVGYSATRETVYMVPYEVLDMRNRLVALKQEESEEILRILSDLSWRCSKELDKIVRDYEVVQRLDRYFGSASFGQSYDGSISELSDDELTLSSFFHPLLKAEKVVNNFLSLGKDKPRILLIAGPNAGGKSVLIRAVGLAVLMDRMGLFVPAHEGARIPFLDHVYYLGGDNQSVLDNLSTFSSHLLGIKEIALKATKDSLVIIDEVGEGTSPKDGEALGVSLLKYFEKLSSFTLLTSHFDGVKNYAMEDEKVLSGAMEFRKETLSPTYRLLLGTTGNSYGLLLAEKMGLPEAILKEARNYQSSLSTRDLDSLMEKVTEEKNELDRKLQALESRKRELDRLVKKRQEQIQAINEEKGNIHRKAKEKIDRLVEKRIQEIDQAFRSQGNPSTFSEVSKAKGELNKILREEIPAPVAAKPVVKVPELKKGDEVIDEDNRKGIVVDVKKNECTVDYDGLKIRRKIVGLSLAPSRPVPVKKKVYVDSVHLDLLPSRGMELNIIGLHVDEAMREVVSFLDSSRLRRFGHVRIIHGAGTFALKNAVWKYLHNHPEFVKSYRLGQEGEGGLGATVVELK